MCWLLVWMLLSLKLVFILIQLVSHIWLLYVICLCLITHVYTCTHCGRKGHLVKFCYDRIHDSNFANKYVWVRKRANPNGPKKVWCGFSQDVRVSKPWWWMRFELKDHIYGCITFKDVWWEDHHALKTKISSLGLITISYFYLLYMLSQMVGNIWRPSRKNRPMGT